MSTEPGAARTQFFLEPAQAPGEQPPGAQLPSFSALPAGFGISVALTEGLAGVALGAVDCDGFSAVALGSLLEHAASESPANRATNASRVTRFGSELCIRQRSLAFGPRARPAPVERRGAKKDRGPVRTV